MARISKLWVEKYRPQQLNQCILQTSQKQFFENIVSSKEIPHLLFSGIQGTGKTTLSLVLVNDIGIDDSDVLLVKASEETGVDTMRDKIKGFAQSYALSKFKIVRLEEMDFLSPNAQGALRTVMEDYSDNCRFIGTCNYENKIIPALKSRFQHFHFKAPDKSEVTIRIAEILAEEAIEFDLDTLDKLVSVGYPDVRKTINLAQQYSSTGVLKIDDVSSDGDWKFTIIDAMKVGDLKTIRKVVCENATREEFEDLYRFLYQNITKLPGMTSEKQDAAIVIIANYLYKHGIIADPEICFTACIIELSSLQ